MKLSEVATDAAIGAETWARRTAVKPMSEIAGSEDPAVFVTAAWPAEAGPLVVTLRAALSAGFAVATVTTDPRSHNGAKLRVTIEPWVGVASNLRVDSEGDPEDAPLPVTLTIGDGRIEGSKRERGDLLEFYRACIAAIDRSY